MPLAILTLVFASLPASTITYTAPPEAVASTTEPVAVSREIIEIPEEDITRVPISTTTAKRLIDAAADKYGADPERLYRTLACESMGFTAEQSEVPNEKGPNGRENSWGVAQIHLSAHTSITRAQALNPQWAIDWAAQQFAKHHERMWTCYRIFYEQASSTTVASGQ